MHIGNVMTESLALVDALHPASQAAGTVNGAAVDMGLFERLQYTLDVGAMTAASTVDLKLQASVDAAFTTPIDIPGKAITQLLAAGGNNRVVKLACVAEDLLNLVATQPGCRYVRSRLVVAAAPSVLGIVAHATAGKFKPENAYDIAAVVQTISDAA